MYGNHMQHPAFNALGSGMYAPQQQQQQNPYGNFAMMGGMYGQPQQQYGSGEADGSNPFGPNFRKNMGLMGLSQQLMQPGHQFNMNDGLYAAMAMQGMPGMGGGGQ